MCVCVCNKELKNFPITSSCTRQTNTFAFADNNTFCNFVEGRNESWCFFVVVVTYVYPTCMYCRPSGASTEHNFTIVLHPKHYLHSIRYQLVCGFSIGCRCQQELRAHNWQFTVCDQRGQRLQAKTPFIRGLRSEFHFIFFAVLLCHHRARRIIN